MRKPRCDSKLEGLDDDQKRQLCEWLLTPGLSYAGIVKRLFEEFNVSSSSRALSGFYNAYVSAYVIARRRQAVGLAVEVGEEARQAPGKFSDATIDALEQQAFLLAQNPMVNPKDVKAIFSLVLKAREQQFDRDKWETESCEKILKAARDPKMREIVEAEIPNAEKIALIRKAYFADIDAINVELPPA